MEGENPVISELTKMEKIRIAKASAPANVSENAMILDADRSVLQEGGNGWTCMVGTPPSYGNPMCMDEIWVAYFDAYYAKAPYSPPADTIGFSYMLVGDLPMDNDDPFNLDESKNTWVQEGPHLMMLVPQTMFGSLPTSPYRGGALRYVEKVLNMRTLWFPSKKPSRLPTLSSALPHRGCFSIFWA